MTRFKKELKKKGFKFSEDYPWLPIEEGSHGVYIEDVDLNEEKSYIWEGTNVALVRFYLNRSLEIKREEWLQ